MLSRGCNLGQEPGSPAGGKKEIAVALTRRKFHRPSGCLRWDQSCAPGGLQDKIIASSGVSNPSVNNKITRNEESGRVGCKVSRRRRRGAQCYFQSSLYFIRCSLLRLPGSAFPGWVSMMELGSSSMGSVLGMSAVAKPRGRVQQRSFVIITQVLRILVSLPGAAMRR